MQNKQYILFDFDGTLFKSDKGIVNAVRYALSLEGIEEIDINKLQSFIGPPIHYSFTKNYPQFSEEKIADIVVNMRKYYSTKGYKETELYDDVVPLLKELKAQGKTLAIATAKPTIYAKQILEIFELSHYFSSIQGSLNKGELFPKERIIGSVLNDFNLLDTEDCVMIGDTIYDIKGANEHQMQSIGVCYGYGKRQNLKDAGANIIVETVAELTQILV